MNKHRILVFDVETTGLLPKASKASKASKGPSDPSVVNPFNIDPSVVNPFSIDPSVVNPFSIDPSVVNPFSIDPSVVNPFSIDLNPYIIQFSFILYNLQTRAIERKHDFYINPPIDIPEIITEITGITKETCVKKGVPIIVALDCFYDCYTMSNTVIAHNMAFDAAMVRIELERNREEIDRIAHYCLNIFDATFEKSHGIDQFCTMRYGTNICNIMVLRVSSAARLNPSLPLEVSREPKEILVQSNPDITAKPPTKYKKWPTLLEFHKHLFNTVPANLHNSIVDVLVCLRCFLKSYKRIVIEDAEFEQMQKYLVSSI